MNKKIIDDNIFPDKIKMKKIRKQYKKIKKLLKKDPNAVFFSIYNIKSKNLADGLKKIKNEN